ncbi:MAG UNVERIFIED_CONTAM: hypothetical protein LVR29_01820 [Microcystis novacekii LVE1205-3]
MAKLVDTSVTGKALYSLFNIKINSRFLSTTRGLFKLRLLINPIYSPKIPMKNNCTEENKNNPTMIARYSYGKKIPKQKLQNQSHQTNQKTQ